LKALQTDDLMKTGNRQLKIRFWPYPESSQRRAEIELYAEAK
jgi:hypothetical protein